MVIYKHILEKQKYLNFLRKFLRFYDESDFSRSAYEVFWKKKSSHKLAVVIKIYNDAYKMHVALCFSVFLSLFV